MVASLFDKPPCYQVPGKYLDVLVADHGLATESIMQASHSLIEGARADPTSLTLQREKPAARSAMRLHESRNMWGPSAESSRQENQRSNSKTSARGANTWLAMRVKMNKIKKNS